MHAQALGFFADRLGGLPPLRVVEFGSLDVNGSVRSVYPLALTWHGIDRHPGRGVDEVADAAHWSTLAKFDVVVCAEVFEHSDEWRDIIATAYDVLVPGGILVASCATGDRPPHSITGEQLEDGAWYRNIPKADMTKALKGWSEKQVRVADGHFGADDLYVYARK